jgi:hypothetical protein
MPTESQLKNEIRTALKEDFRIYEEVSGVSIVENSVLRIDFMCYPGDELISRGFDRAWFGIEAKSPDSKEPWKKGMRFAWQAINYSQCDFYNIGRPAFVLMYPGVQKFFQLKDHIIAGLLFKSFIIKSNIGELVIDDRFGWSIRFADQRYFRKDLGKGNVKNLGLVKHIGSE